MRPMRRGDNGELRLESIWHVSGPPHTQLQEATMHPSATPLVGAPVPTNAPLRLPPGRRHLPGGGPLQFLRDTLLGPKPVEEEDRLHAAHAQHATRHRHHAAEPPTATTAAPAGTSTDPRVLTGVDPGLPTAVGLPPTAPPGSYATALGAVQPATGPADLAAAAREQMREVATHGTGGAGAVGAALGTPPPGGVGRLVAETVTGPRGDAGGRTRERVPEQEPTDTGTGGGGGAGGGGVGGFVAETLLGPKAEAVDRGAATEQQLPGAWPASAMS